jgi:hypothetical protein
MLAALVRSLQSFFFPRPLVGAAGVALLALGFIASALMRQPRVFGLSVPVAGALILAQGVGSTVWLSGLRPRRASRRGWIIPGQAAAAVFCWLVLVWIFWLRS